MPGLRRSRLTLVGIVLVIACFAVAIGARELLHRHHGFLERLHCPACHLSHLPTVLGLADLEWSPVLQARRTVLWPLPCWHSAAIVLRSVSRAPPTS